MFDWNKAVNLEISFLQPGQMIKNMITARIYDSFIESPPVGMFALAGPRLGLDLGDHEQSGKLSYNFVRGLPTNPKKCQKGITHVDWCLVRPLGKDKQIIYFLRDFGGFD